MDGNRCKEEEAVKIVPAHAAKGCNRLYLQGID
jgi:hypothetical protein